MDRNLRLNTNRVLAIHVLLLVCLVSVLGVRAAEVGASFRLNLAAVNLTRGLLQDSEMDLDRAKGILETMPICGSHCYRFLGEVSLARSESEKAYLYFSDASSSDPLIVLGLGKSLWAWGMSKDAVSVMRQVVPSSYFWNLGSQQCSSGNISAARQAFEVAEQLPPRDASGIALAGKCWSQQGDWSIAVKYYRQAVSLRPENEFLHFALGEALYKKQDRTLAEAEEAVEQLQQGLSIRPWLAAYINLGELLGALGRRDEAIAVWYEARSRFPQSSTPPLYLGQYALNERDFANAKLYLDEAVSRDAQHGGIHYFRGLLYLWQGMPEQALPELEMAVALWPDRYDFRLELAHTYEIMGDIDQARQQYAEVLSKNPANQGALEALHRLSAGSEKR